MLPVENVSIERAREDLDLPVPVVIAIDDPSLSQAPLEAAREMSVRAGILALALLKDVLRQHEQVDVVGDTVQTRSLPKWLQSTLCRSLCSGALEAGQVRGLARAPLFPTATGALVSWQELRRQANTFGDVWLGQSGGKPANPDRLLLVLGPAETPEHFGDTLRFVDASSELALEDLARCKPQPIQAAAYLSRLEPGGAQRGYHSDEHRERQRHGGSPLAPSRGVAGNALLPRHAAHRSIRRSVPMANPCHCERRGP